MWHLHALDRELGRRHAIVEAQLPSEAAERTSDLAVERHR